MIWQAIRHDTFRYVSSSRKTSTIKAIFKNPGLRFTVLYRLCRSFNKTHPIGIIARLWFSKLQVKFGFQIPHTADIGPGLFLGHFGNIVINAGAKLGRNCNVAQGVTIGYVSAGKRKGYPVIGNKVWIGANAVVVGNIKVGDNVLIAPLSFVNFDVPDNAVIINGKIVSDKGSEGYVNKTLEDK